MHGVLLVACVLFWASLAQAVEYFVDNSCAGCANSNSCTQAQTVTTGRTTINRGIACLNPGDTLTIKAGTYPEYIHDVTNTGCPTCERIPSGTSWATATTIRGAPGELVRIRPVWVPTAGFIIKFKQTSTINPSQYIILKNLTVDGVLYTADPQEQGGLGIYGPNHHIRCDECHMTDTSTYVMYAHRQSSGSGPVSDGNEFINGSGTRSGSKNPRGYGGEDTGYGHCFYTSTSNNLIANNVINGCAGNGISIYRHGEDVNNYGNNIVRNNLITNNASCRSVANPNCVSQNKADGGMHIGGDNNQVYNNVLYNIKNGGISIGANDPDGNLVANNTICGIPGTTVRGFRAKPGSGTTRFVNNLAYQVAVPFVDEGVGTIRQTNSFDAPVIANPAFVAPCTNMRLMAASPAAARTGGTTLTTPFTTDLAGLTRTGGWSMGAYEYGETTGVLHLAFSTPPAGGVEGTTLPPVLVQVLNEASVLQTGHAATCVLSKASGPGTLSGTLTVAPSGGVCTWSTLALSQEGTYTLLVTSTGTTSVTSTAFTIAETPVEPVAPIVGLKLYGVR